MGVPPHRVVQDADSSPALATAATTTATESRDAASSSSLPLRSRLANMRARRIAVTSRSKTRPKTVNMATMASAVRDIATTSGRDNLAVVAAREVPVTTHPANLPTPPNSISPSLPPHGLKAQLQRARLEPIDSDLDLHDEHGSPLGSPPLDSAGAITPAMLAKFHLPDILLNHGPLSIRHLMGYLTTQVPGFAGIPPAKARRLVVGALEGRGGKGEGGGVDGDVEFMKVGWGTWDAKRRGKHAGNVPTMRMSPTSELYPTSIPIAKVAGWKVDRNRLAASASSAGGQWSAAFSHDDRDNMMDHEADKMSLDGSGSASCSEAPDDDDDMLMNDDPEDMTDEEDWAAVGAAALRASSYQPQQNRQFPFGSVYSPGGLRSCSATVGMARPPQLGSNFGFSASALGAPTNAQEREAVEALLSLGSV